VAGTENFGRNHRLHLRLEGMQSALREQRWPGLNMLRNERFFEGWTCEVPSPVEVKGIFPGQRKNREARPDKGRFFGCKRNDPSGTDE
jgi:hypothetical protein